MCETLGQGEFGVVKLALATDIRGLYIHVISKRKILFVGIANTVKVAVKMAKDELLHPCSMTDLISEYCLMKEVLFSIYFTHVILAVIRLIILM